MNLDYLFVYGTLRRKSEHHMYHILARYADFIDDGYVFGKLYEVDNYPGLKLTSSKYNKVYGEVYRLHNTKYVFDKLDDYEECSDKYPKPHEYKRVKVDVYLNSGKVLKAWVYEYNYSIEKLKLISSGDYMEYINRKI